MTIKRFFLDLITISDGKTGCYARLYGWLSWLAGSTMYFYECITKTTVIFSFTDYMMGCGAHAAAIAGAILMKKTDEPKGE